MTAAVGNHGPVGDPGPVGVGAGALTVSGGGSVLVATDAVFAELAALRVLQAEAELWQEQLGRVRALGVGPAPGWQPGDLGACVFGASVAIDAVADRSRRLAGALEQTAEDYGRLEAGLDTVLQGTGAWLAHTVGLLAPVLALALATPLAYLAVGSLLSSAARGGTPSVIPPWLSAWLGENPRLLTHPATVAVVRALVSSADEAVLGRLGVPYPVAAVLGDEDSGPLGAHTTALGLLIAARAAGLLRETPVRVTRVGSSVGVGVGVGVGAEARVGAGAVGTAQPGPPGRGGNGSGDRPRTGPETKPLTRPESRLVAPNPPGGFADLADRIPTDDDDGGQVRIERYGDAEHPAWLVFIGGTVEWSPTGSTEPWDMASNVAAVADQEAGSYRAVLQAMQAAGVQPGDPVVPVAHSQGGLIANQLVARGDINAVGLVTFGAPAGPEPVPAGLPAIAIEHSDDIIPALAGRPPEDDGRLYLRRELFAGTPVPPDEALPAHQLSGYRETARIADESIEPRLAAFRDQLGRMVGTAPGQQSVWHAERLR